nr:putative capsular polysaccharide synthesis family protein [Salinibacter ruber]
MSFYRWTRATYGIVRRHPVRILVYQMGKVGSTSVQRSLYDAGFGPLHVHYIHADLPHMERFTETEKDFPLHFYIGRVLRYYLAITSHRLKIITLVRDPIARFISAQFQTLDHEPIPPDDADSAVQQLRETIRSKPETVRFRWFKREMEPLLGVNPIKEPFDREAGYGRVESSRADVLVLKLERLSELIPTVVSSFVGEKLSVVRANEGQKKNYADYYREVLDRFDLSEETCRRIYDHAHTTHFYTPDETHQFVEKWTT